MSPELRVSPELGRLLMWLGRGPIEEPRRGGIVLARRRQPRVERRGARVEPHRGDIWPGWCDAVWRNVAPMGLDATPVDPTPSWCPPGAIAMPPLRTRHDMPVQERHSVSVPISLLTAKTKPTTIFPSADSSISAVVDQDKQVRLRCHIATASRIAPAMKERASFHHADTQTDAAEGGLDKVADLLPWTWMDIQKYFRPNLSIRYLVPTSKNPDKLIPTGAKLVFSLPPRALKG